MGRSVLLVRALPGADPLSWLPSHRVPPLPYGEVDWRMRMTLGKAELHRMWADLWWSGVAAGRVEGIVGTLLVVVVLSLMVLAVVVAIKAR